LSDRCCSRDKKCKDMNQNNFGVITVNNNLLPVCVLVLIMSHVLAVWRIFAKSSPTVPDRTPSNPIKNHLNPNNDDSLDIPTMLFCLLYNNMPMISMPKKLDKLHRTISKVWSSCPISNLISASYVRMRSKRELKPWYALANTFIMYNV
jgi:hypothetical protein